MKNFLNTKKTLQYILSEENFEAIRAQFEDIENDPDKNSVIGILKKDYIYSVLDELLDETNIGKFIQENIERAQIYIKELEEHKLILPEAICLNTSINEIRVNIKDNCYTEKFFYDLLVNCLSETAQKPLDFHYNYYAHFLIRTLLAENYYNNDNVEQAKYCLKDSISSYLNAQDEIKRVFYERTEKAKEEIHQEIMEKEAKRQNEIKEKEEEEKKKEAKKQNTSKGGLARAEKFLPIKYEIIRIIENPPSGVWLTKDELKDEIIYGVEEFLTVKNLKILSLSNLSETISKWLSNDESVKPTYQKALSLMPPEVSKKSK